MADIEMVRIEELMKESGMTRQGVVGALAGLSMEQSAHRCSGPKAARKVEGVTPERAMVFLGWVRAFRKRFYEEVNGELPGIREGMEFLANGPKPLNEFRRLVKLACGSEAGVQRVMKAVAPVRWAREGVWPPEWVAEVPTKV